jgi:hypothetical protein
MRSNAAHGLLSLGLVLGTGCQSECEAETGSWCSNDMVYSCASTSGAPRGSRTGVSQVIEDCKSLDGTCKELRPNEAYCVVPEQSCAMDASAVCYDGNAHACVAEHVVSKPSEKCADDTTCIPTEDGKSASCGPDDGGGGGAGGVGIADG